MRNVAKTKELEKLKRLFDKYRDQKHFGRIHKIVTPDVVDAVRSTIKDSGVAQICIAESWVKLINSKKKFSDVEDLVPYIAKAAKNKFYDDLKSEKRRKERESNHPYLSAEPDSIDTIIEKEETKEVIKIEFGKLEPTESYAVDAVLCGGRKSNEIAKDPSFPRSASWIDKRVAAFTKRVQTRLEKLQ